MQNPVNKLSNARATTDTDCSRAAGGMDSKITGLDPTPKHSGRPRSAIAGPAMREIRIRSSLTTFAVPLAVLVAVAVAAPARGRDDPPAGANTAAEVSPEEPAASPDTEAETDPPDDAGPEAPSPTDAAEPAAEPSGFGASAPATAPTPPRAEMDGAANGAYVRMQTRLLAPPTADDPAALREQLLALTRDASQVALLHDDPAIRLEALEVQMQALHARLAAEPEPDADEADRQLARLRAAARRAAAIDLPRAASIADFWRLTADLIDLNRGPLDEPARRARAAARLHDYLARHPDAAPAPAIRRALQSLPLPPDVSGDGAATEERETPEADD